MRKSVSFCLLLAVLFIPLLIAAQTTPAENAPPAVLQIIREAVKPGKAAAHQKVEAGFVAAYKKTNPQHYFLGTNSMTGSFETWFFIGFTSMGDAEKAYADVAAHKAVQAEMERLTVSDGELLNGGYGQFAYFNPELSYRPEFNLGEFKYFTVDTIRIRSGQYEKLAQALKVIKAAHEKANLDEHMVVYKVALGGPAGTVLIFQPFRSLKDLDEVQKLHGEGSAFQKAIGEDGNKILADYKREGSESYQVDLLAISPPMSFVSEKVIATNPSFWKPKPEVAKAPAAKTVIPAAKKEVQAK